MVEEDLGQTPIRSMPAKTSNQFVSGLIVQGVLAVDHCWQMLLACQNIAYLKQVLCSSCKDQGLRVNSRPQVYSTGPSWL